MGTPSAADAAAGQDGLSAAAADITNRIERLPNSSWHVKARLLIGTATFFDAFDALTIAQVLPVLAPLWKLTGPQIGFMISIGYLGQLFGALFFGWIAERYGRILGIALATATFALMSLACAFAWDYDSFLIFRTIQGFGLGGEVPIAAVYISELTRAHGRGRFVLLYELIFSVGVVAAAIVGYFVVPTLGWQYMFYIGVLPSILVVPLFWLLPESPRWLASRRRIIEANKALAVMEMATERATGKPLPPVAAAIASYEQKSMSWRDLFGPLYLRRTIVLWVIWFSSYIVYYGIGIWLPTLYRTVFHLPLEVALAYGLLSNIIGLIGATVCALTIDKFGRRPWLAISLGCSGICLGSLWFLNGGTFAQVVVFASGAYFFAISAALCVYVYTPELYPTRVRALGTGMATAWLRLGSMVGPSIVGAMIGGGLGSVFLSFGAVAIVAAVVTALFAIETKGRILEELAP
jgi:putative MFS transporter